MVFYRKYRPQRIDDLDNESVRKTLFSVLSKYDSVPHAFLFTGPKGLGKTSAARIVAKAVNCEGISNLKSQISKQSHKGTRFYEPSHLKSKNLNKIENKDQIEPCNECEQCISITNGTNMDVLEIDAASNRGIDEIRDLREKIGLSPLSARKKVYIIDEVHMLTTEAFNALLKTLEEPPSHAMFILCTTEPHKVPATIISRSFHIQFKLASGDEIVRSLKRIRDGEKLPVDDEALYAIAKMAEGGFRDAAKILEELSMLAQGQKITKESFEKSYKISTIPIKVASLLGALKVRNAKSGLQVVSELAAEGIDIRFFITEVLIDLHKKLLIKLGVEPGREEEFPVNLRFEIDEIKDLYELLGKAYQEMKTAVLPQLPLEMAIVEYAARDAQGVVAADSEGQEGGEKSSFAEATADKPEGKNNGITVAKLRRQAGTITKIKALYGQAKPGTGRHPVSQSESGDGIEKTTEKPIELMHVPANGEVTPEWIAAFWRGIISEMKRYNHTIAGVLRSCSIKSYDKKLLVIDAAYKFHKERLDVPKVRTALREACKILTGNDMEIEVQLKKHEISA